MSNQRRGGIIQLSRNGILLEAKGNFTFGLGTPKREAIVGSGTVHGFKETPQVAFIEGALTDSSSLDLAELFNGNADTITCELANGKVIALRDAWFAGDGQGSTEEGEVPVRWESINGEEIR
jgi:hypothetical protein